MTTDVHTATSQQDTDQTDAGDQAAADQQPAEDPTAVAVAARELALYDSDAGTITIPTAIGGHYLTFTAGQRTLDEKQMHLLAPLGIEANFDPAQVAVFLMQAQARGLDPWAKEAYLLRLGGKYINHTGIGGFRRLAEETGLYAGRIGPQWCGADGQWLDVWLDRDHAPYAARVGILRRDRETPEWGLAYYDEYAPIIDEEIWDRGQKRKTGRRVPAAKWKIGKDGGSANLMIAKCAEAAGFRSAFPALFGGFYAGEETERMRYEAKATAEPSGVAAAAAKRREAYEAAQQSAEATRPASAPMFEQFGYSDVIAKALLLAELAEHGVVLNKSRDEMTAKWSEARGGQPVTAWSLGDVFKLLQAIRKITIAYLRGADRAAEADALAMAPPVGPVTEVFGRRSVVIEHDEDEPRDGAEVEQ